MHQTLLHKLRLRSTWAKIFTHLFLIIGGFFMLYPLIFTFLGSLLDKDDFLTITLMPWPSGAPDFSNLLLFFQYDGVFSSIGITLASFVFHSFWVVITSLLAGYVFARVDFKGKTFVFYLLMASMMIPTTATLLPTYLLYARIPLIGGNGLNGMGGRGLIGSWPVLFVGGLISAYNIFLIKQSIAQTGFEISESAEIDGAGNFRIVFSIYMPLMRPVLAVIIIGLFFGQWNDYLFPMIFMMNTRTSSLMPIGYFVFEIIEDVTGPSGTYPNYPAIFGVSFMNMLPPILVFAILQKQFVEGLALGSLKG